MIDIVIAFPALALFLAAILWLAPSYCCMMGVARMCFARRATRGDGANLLVLLLAAVAVLAAWWLLSQEWFWF